MSTLLWSCSATMSIIKSARQIKFKLNWINLIQFWFFVCMQQLGSQQHTAFKQPEIIKISYTSVINIREFAKIIEDLLSSHVKRL